ncbi:MAG TPA: CoA-binding protein [Actinomycetota bacterium]|nr:CoA-binding protein [Actinomycetota bacterium]
MAAVDFPEPYAPDDTKLRSLLDETRTIAVVGLSSKPWRDSLGLARYLQDAGYRIIPVNPKETEVLGEQAYPTLADVPEPIDMVDVFRRADQTPDVARDAVAVGAKSLWLQLDIVSDEARAVAEEGGLDVVMGLCIKVEHRRLGIAPKR